MKHILSKKIPAFTKAEVFRVLTLIVLVFAVIAIALTGNMKKNFAEQGKALYASVSQAVALLGNIDSYDSAEDLIKNGLSKVITVNTVCLQANLQDCGVNLDSITGMDGSEIPFPKTWSDLGVTSEFSDFTALSATDEQVASSLVAGFTTDKSESVVLFYNPDCVPNEEYAPKSLTSARNGVKMFDYVCINMLYDVNANKAPNAFGKDIGLITVFYPSDFMVVSPIPYLATTSISSANAIEDGVTCENEYRLPNRFEAASLMLNYKLLNPNGDGDYLTSSKAASGRNTYTFWQSRSKLSAYTKTGSDSNIGLTRCVKR